MAHAQGFSHPNRPNTEIVGKLSNPCQISDHFLGEMLAVTFYFSLGKPRVNGLGLQVSIFILESSYL